jgi:phosphatidylglycerophosphate synthase
MPGMPDGPSPSADRRPIRSRSLRIWITTAKTLANWGITANTISIFGMLFCIWAGACFAATGIADARTARWLWVAAGVLVQLRLICNMLDGMVALERNEASPVGELYNEIPDRISDMSALIGLGYAASSNPQLGYLAAGLAVLVAYIRAAARAAGAPSDFRGPMAKQQRMFFVTVVAAYMGFAPESWTLATWRGLAAPALVLLLICIGCVITSIRRVVRASGILRDRGTP